ncbi:hypothetical protein QJS10_CPA01g01546 [Acorus calamus]|uniref:Reverse transcriptase zinc-binding domain-containing protein n=1 Tax=Acorus calamus TaxID=4465 RepID=A0AAV9FEH9_ACOCL|nr:hypothetical protein QJS10_CPA01g01546 [Acorus calamus]
MEVGGKGSDILIWTGNRTGTVTCSSAWQIVRKKNPVIDWTMAIWSSVVPPRWSFLCWQAGLKKLPTLVRLQKWGIVMSDRFNGYEMEDSSSPLAEALAYASKPDTPFIQRRFKAVKRPNAPHIREQMLKEAKPTLITMIWH